ncbi:peptide-methionine (S)-S-oxide reductase MsrA [Nonomuraea sp. K274]|uniref:peptide-methionine (S)-S-oxide reductase n=1 Tax=Nonomuraea cypriaca TaxID=1187855 RepID=A0A931F1G6_9ACTN|nr:peptide-methionine (S)-S-oxide reductase MsrA [Nonomuraea cypriaca]MBF8188136.1 peptide-methionine (S)-S-oxide reductase MsrA [Nonomuraea cypriaca]
MQDLLRKKDGVVSTRVTGGENEYPAYRHHPGHAEAVEIVYDPLQITYRELLEFFFQVHDPTTLNRQGNDVGTIFYQNEQQRDIANATIKDVETSGLWPGKIVTEVIPAGTFREAEPEHQDYLIKHPNGYTCHYVDLSGSCPTKNTPADGTNCPLRRSASLWALLRQTFQLVFPDRSRWVTSWCGY